MSRRAAFVFPGQGSQRVGMLDRLPDAEAAARLVEQAETLSGVPLGSIAANGPDAALADTRASQPLLYIVDLLWARALAEAGVTPAVVAGHSLGEYAALAFARVFDDETGLALICERSRLMAEAAAAAGGTMAAVLGMDRSSVANALGGIPGVWVANDNGPGQVVVSGTHAGIERALEVLTAVGARRVVPLSVAGPFHSPLMAPAADAFAAVLAETPFADARVPVAQNTGAEPAVEADTLRQRLASQIVSPVGWTATLEAFVSSGVEIQIECGPGSVLTGIVKRYPGLEGVSVETDGIERVREVIG
jgi:[acyl-carrier-protein] S-malonyltransferase